MDWLNTDETSLTFTSPDAGVTTLQSVQGGIDGAPAATDGNNVLKLVWAGETDRKVEIRHQWSNLTFDLAGYDEIRADIYIATASRGVYIFFIQTDQGFLKWR